MYFTTAVLAILPIIASTLVAAAPAPLPEAAPIRCGRFGSSFCCAYSDGPVCVAYPFKAKRDAAPEPIRCGRFGSSFCCAYSDGPVCVAYPFKAKRDTTDADFKVPTIEEINAQADKEDKEHTAKRSPAPEPIRCGRFGSSFCCAYSEGPTCVAYPFKAKRDEPTSTAPAKPFKTPTADEINIMADLEEQGEDLKKREAEPIRCGRFGSSFCCAYSDGPVCVAYPF